MIRLIRNVILSAATLLLIWFLMGRFNLMPSPGDIFRARPVRVDDAPLLVKEIRGMAELITMTSYDEVVADSVVVDPAALAIRTITGIGPDPARLVIVARGKVLAGTDLAGLSASDIHREKDSISLGLPAARILDITINPADVETFIETGSWNEEAFERVKIRAREKMRARALEQGILEKADKRAVMIMEDLLRKSGYAKVNVHIRAS
jgi:hypothetical protein